VVFQRPKDERKGPPHLLRRAGEAWRSDGLSGLVNRILQRLPRHDEEREKRKAYQRWVARYVTLSSSDRKAIRLRINTFKYKPEISIVMPVYDTDDQWLRRSIESVRGQLYPHWELCIADDCSTAPHVRRILEEFAAKDERIKVAFRNTNGHISAASNTALGLASGEFVALLDHDDELTEHALYLVAEELNEHPGADLIYSDEDKIDSQGELKSPHFKTGWSPDLFYSLNFISHLGVYRRKILEEIGGFRIGYEGSQDYDLALRTIERIPEENIKHIAHVLYHWRESPQSVGFNVEAKSYAHENARKALRSHFQRTENNAKIMPGYFIFHRAVYPLSNPRPLVSLIVVLPQKTERSLAQLERLLTKTNYEPLELVLVVEQGGAVESSSLTRLPIEGRRELIELPAPVNIARACNAGVRAAQGELIAIVRYGLDPDSPLWLEEMAGQAGRVEIGAVGARIYDEKDLLVHAGLILGAEGLVGPAFEALPKDREGYMFRAQVVQNLSAVSGDCLVMRRDVFERSGGFDEENFPDNFGDVDLCLRLQEQGYRIVWTPYAELRRTEPNAGQTYAGSKRKSDAALVLRSKWKPILDCDPYYNPNLSLQEKLFTLAWPPRTSRPWK
jgi:GT2 family glycosyltransferase